MDAAYCNAELSDNSRGLGHVPLIDHNPRHGEKIESLPLKLSATTSGPLPSAAMLRLKDELGAKSIMVKGDPKVMGHLMFGVLALSADQLMPLQLLAHCHGSPALMHPMRPMHAGHSYENEMRQAWALLGERLEMLTSGKSNVLTVEFGKTAG